MMKPVVSDAHRDKNFHALLRYVKERRGVDFSSYRSGTVLRRIGERLAVTGIKDCESYLPYLKENPGEMDRLMDALTIRVSCFFRDPLVFELLGDYVIPDLLRRFSGKALSVWSAGCAGGEEPHSLAILFREACMKEDLFPRIFVLGTDIDQQSLDDARRAVYAEAALDEVKKKYLDRYFIPGDGRYSLREEVSSMASFIAHDVTTCTPPTAGVFSDYHLILCRNLLMYFENDLQTRVLEALSAFLPRGGYLVLGRAESMPGELMSAYDELLPGTKIFRKRGW